MCLVFLNYKMHPEFPIQIGANREEQLSRFQLGVRPTPGFILAGMDYGPHGGFCLTPGTWFGIANHGMVVAVTNRHDGKLHGEDKKDSRGVLCMELLKQSSAKVAKEHAKERLYKGSFGGTNYIIADAESAWYVSALGPHWTQSGPILPGLHTVTNLNVNDPKDERIKYLTRAFHEQQVQDHFMIRAQGLLYSPEILRSKCDDGSGLKCSMIATVNTKSEINFWHSQGLDQPFRDISNYLL